MAPMALTSHVRSSQYWNELILIGYNLGYPLVNKHNYGKSPFFDG